MTKNLFNKRNAIKLNCLRWLFLIYSLSDIEQQKIMPVAEGEKKVVGEDIFLYLVLFIPVFI